MRRAQFRAFPSLSVTCSSVPFRSGPIPFPVVFPSHRGVSCSTSFRSVPSQVPLVPSSTPYPSIPCVATSSAPSSPRRISRNSDSFRPVPVPFRSRPVPFRLGPSHPVPCSASCRPILSCPVRCRTKHPSPPPFSIPPPLPFLRFRSCLACTSRELKQLIHYLLHSQKKTEEAKIRGERRTHNINANTPHTPLLLPSHLPLHLLTPVPLLD